MSFIKPKLFISYAREDSSHADALNAYLCESGFETFFDKKSILIGEIFPDKIMNSIRKSDGFISITSTNSIESEWCKLENYYAHLLGKIIIPIRIGTFELGKNDPLFFIHKGINYAIVQTEEDSHKAGSQVKERLRLVRQIARKRVFKFILIVLCAVGLVFLFFKFGIQEINAINYKKDRKALVNEIKTSDKIFTREDVQDLKGTFSNDPELIAQLFWKSNDPGWSDFARINSKILSSSLHQSFNLTERAYLKEIDWQQSLLENSCMTNHTFMSGVIRQSDFLSVEFSDIYFTGVSNDERGVQLSRLKFSDCSFTGVEFDKSNAVDVLFKNCRFNGSVLDMTNFGSVRFVSDSGSDPLISNGQITYFNNSIIKHLGPPFLADVTYMDVESIVFFKDVIFSGCRFEGNFHPQWFDGCHFDDCTFPKSLDVNKIKDQNNVSEYFQR